jgi:OHCU decarboxylase
MSPEQFATQVAPTYQGDVGIAKAVAERRPFPDANALRAALQDELFSLPYDRQTELMRSYPTLAGPDLSTVDRESRTFVDQAAAGLTFLGEDEQRAFTEVNLAYHDKFGFPLIVAAREMSSEQVLEQAWQRLDNSMRQEHAAALVEIAKIANHRLEDIVEDTRPMGSTRSASLQRLH